MAAGYHHVTRDIRCQIFALKSIGQSLGKIALAVGRNKSTISREISRNTGEREYRFKQADEKAKARRKKAGQKPKKLTDDMKDTIKERLLMDWSPEQISGRLKLEGKFISYETIYQYVWRDNRAGGKLYKHLRHHGKKYNKRGSGKSGRSCIPGRIDITKRPTIVETKSRIGDWEGDTIIGAKHKGAIVSYVDRHSKYTLLKKIQRNTADFVTYATVEKMIDLPHPVRTITYDNGKEFSEHHVIAMVLNTTCYFATPYHSWERGLNEHTNGLVRQYLPKSTDFTQISDEEVQSVDGRYTPRFLKRHYFPDEMVDQLHLSDRILQHILLKQLKPTFAHVMSPNCYQLHGPSGVKLATARIRQALLEDKPQFVIRADIKSFYKSIQHHLLIQDIRRHYDDPKVRRMLEQVITNPIETPRGYKNADHGIALRGPLSQFFSGLFLKPLDDAFAMMDVTYLRFQDDVLILCKAKRQLNRCRRRMMEVLHQRRLSLSGKKTRIGSIEAGFHFLGIHYLGTRPSNNTKVTHVIEPSVKQTSFAHYLNSVGVGGDNATGTTENQSFGLIGIVPHARTLRKEREQTKMMVKDGISFRKISIYLDHWVNWWVRTTGRIWSYIEVLKWFLTASWEAEASAIACYLLNQYHIKQDQREQVQIQSPAFEVNRATV